jgi:hypothetical protein
MLNLQGAMVTTKRLEAAKCCRNRRRGRRQSRRQSRRHRRSALASFAKSNIISARYKPISGVSSIARDLLSKRTIAWISLPCI